jgi:hypothetical protein
MKRLGLVVSKVIGLPGVVALPLLSQLPSTAAPHCEVTARRGDV